MPDLSFIIPVYNEEDNLDRLYTELTAAAEPLKLTYEVVLTDDASTDRSWEILQQLTRRDPRWRSQRFEYNCGESAASAAGMRAADGDILITLDADLSAFLRALENADCVCGSRVHHRADNWVRRASSRIANAVRNCLSGEQITDAGCTYRAFRRPMLADVQLFRGAHRFLPTLFRMAGYRVVEIPITPRERFAGYSKYGISNRVFKSFADLLAVRWMKSRRLNYRVAGRIGK